MDDARARDSAITRRTALTDSSASTSAPPSAVVQKRRARRDCVPATSRAAESYRAARTLDVPTSNASTKGGRASRGAMVSNELSSGTPASYRKSAGVGEGSHDRRENSAA